MRSLFPTRWRLFAAVLWCVMLSGPGCKTSAHKTLSIYAASSLVEVFGELKRRFERENPGARVALYFAGSQVLRLQLEQGAAADLFASANALHVQSLVDKGLLQRPRVFAHNQLVVIVPLHNPAKIRTFAQLPRARRLVLGTRQVPIGGYTRLVLQRAAAKLGSRFEKTVLSHVVSREANVRLVRAKVALGEADAALVYRTDAMASSRVRAIPVPAEFNVHARYLIAVHKLTKVPSLARRWLRALRSAKGQALLQQHGFRTKHP